MGIFKTKNAVPNINPFFSELTGTYQMAAGTFFFFFFICFIFEILLGPAGQYSCILPQFHSFLPSLVFSPSKAKNLPEDILCRVWTPGTSLPRAGYCSLWSVYMNHYRTAKHFSFGAFYHESREISLLKCRTPDTVHNLYNLNT